MKRVKMGNFKKNVEKKRKAEGERKFENKNKN